MDEQGTWDHDHVLVVTEGIDPNQQCKLQLSFPKGDVLLSDNGGRCTQVYCGAHGQLDRVKLSKVRTNSK
jgi:hypothetical protein